MVRDKKCGVETDKLILAPDRSGTWSFDAAIAFSPSYGTKINLKQRLI
jgi:hypothetical protein